MLQPKLYKLSNGIPVILDPLPGFESLTVGVYIGAGSRHEAAPADYGIAHMLEHMMFKGTKTRTAREITDAVESVGGIVNAYTTWNMTAFHATLPCAHRAAALDVLSDILKNVSCPDAELAKEKQIVIQEILMYQDMPESVLEDFAHDTVFRGGMRHPIAGTVKSVAAMTREQIMDFYAKHYSASNTVLVLSGGCIDDADKTIAELEKYFGDVAAFDTPAFIPTKYEPAMAHKCQENLHHTYFRLMWELPPMVKRNDLADERMLMYVLGHGFGSRLFQKLREELGIVYDINANMLAFPDVSVAVIEGQTDSDKIPAAFAAIKKLTDEFADVTAAELSRAQEIKKSLLVVGLESSPRRADYFGVQAIQFGGADNLAAFIDSINAATTETVTKAARKIFAAAPSIITVGPEN